MSKNISDSEVLVSKNKNNPENSRGLKIKNKRRTKSSKETSSKKNSNKTTKG